jgi:hypothetical protein
VREARELDRAEVRRVAIERFNVDRMVDDYEAVYRRVAAGSVEPMQRFADRDPSALQRPMLVQR